MTFTFGSDLTDDLDWLRFKTGDTAADEAYLTDELITSLLAVSASKEAAAVAAVGYILTQFSKPDFKADWLEIKRSTARAGFEKVLARLEAEVGISDTANSFATGQSVQTYRLDSAATEAPDYAGGRGPSGYPAEEA